MERPVMRAYEDDLAYIHDVGFGGFARGAAPGVLRFLQQSRSGGKQVIDLGCGSGIWARHLVDAGYRVVGVDISASMIALARKRAPEATFHVASLWDFQLPKCDAVTALGEALCYRLDGARRPNLLRQLMRSIYQSLNPGGLLIFDLAELGLDRNRPPAWSAGQDWACLVRFEYDHSRQQLIRHIVTFRKLGIMYRRHEESHRVQLYDCGEEARQLRRTGFRVRTVRRFGSFDLLPGRVGFVARKPVARQSTPAPPRSRAGTKRA